MKKDFQLDKEELEILEAIENNEFISLKEKNFQEFENEKQIAKDASNNTLTHLTKKKAYTIKLFESDVEKIKAMALKKGLPYQTFIASILHQVATKQIEV